MRIWIVAALVLAADVATKVIVHTSPWAMHSRPLGWQLSALVGVSCFVLVAFLYRPLAFASAIIVAGALGNLADSLDGAVCNPFLLHLRAGTVAFNLADVALLLGGVLFVVSLPRLTRDIAWRLHRVRV